MTAPEAARTLIRVHGSVAHHTLCARRPSRDLVFGAVATGPGGAGGAVARQVARLGGRASLTAGIGIDATGDELVRELTADGVDCGSVVRSGTSTKVVVVVEDGVELTCAPGSEITPGAWPADAGAGRTIDWLSGFPSMAAVIRGTHRAGDGPVVDLGYAPWGCDPAALLDHALPLAPHIGTAVVSGGRLADGDVAVVAGALRLAGCSRVIATRAERGVDVFDQSGRRRFAPHRVEQVDPLCAGDAFIAGYLEALSRGLGVAAAVQRGQDVAACKIGMFGEFPTAAQVDAWRQGRAG
jgi:sugar/nucleoside kinase (ribokinase family)